MSLNSNDSARLIEQADVLIDMDRANAAIPLLHKALALTPDDANLLGVLSRAYLLDNQDENALKYAELAIRADPTDWWAHRLRSAALSSAAASMTPIQSLAGDRKTASLEAASEAVRLSPLNEQALYSLSRAHLALGSLVEAKETAETIRHLHPELTSSYELLGLIALRQKRWEEAELRNRQMLKLDPDSSLAMTNLGVALQELMRYREAAVVLYNAAVLNPASRNARRNVNVSLDSYLTQPLLAMSPGHRQPSMRRRIAHLPVGLRDYISLEGKWKIEPERGPVRLWEKLIALIIFVGCTVAGVWSALWLRDSGFRPKGTFGWVVYLGMWIGAITCIAVVTLLNPGRPPSPARTDQDGRDEG